MSAVTDSEVMNAVRELTAEGVPLSLNRIRDKLGHGSFSTIKALLRANGIETVRATTKTSNNLEDLKEPVVIALVQDLQVKLLKTRLSCELLEQELSSTPNAKLLGELVFKEVLAKILAKHMHSTNPLRTFCLDQASAALLNTTDKEFTTKMLAEMKLMLLDSLIELCQTADSSLFAGGAESLEAMQRMLTDLKNRSNSNVQAYRY